MSLVKSQLSSAYIKAALDKKITNVQRASASDKFLVRDHFLGQNIFTASTQTRQCYPGPGTMTVSSYPSSTTMQISDGLTMVHAFASGVGPVAQFGALTASAGLTIIAHTYFPSRNTGADVTSGPQISVGFSHNNDAALRRGAVLLSQDPTGGWWHVRFSRGDSLTDDAQWNGVGNIVRPGDRVALAVHYESLTAQTYWIQAPGFSALGAYVGGPNWYPIGRTSLDLTGQSVRPYVGSQYPGIAIFEKVEVLSQWSPGAAKQFDYSRGKVGIHIPVMERDPGTGYLVMVWNNGTQHINPDARVSVQLPSGEWTTPQTLTTYNGTNSWGTGSLAQVNGQLWFIADKTESGVDGGVLRYFVLSVAEDGTVTKGSEQSFTGIPDDELQLTFTRWVTLPSGRLLMSYHMTNGSELETRIARSDDNGATWSVSSVPQSSEVDWQVEGTMSIESDGAVGLWLRTDNYVAYYSRSTDNGVTWSTPIAVNGIACPRNSTFKGNRMMTTRLPNGDVLLVAADHRLVRKNLVVYTLGTNSVIKGTRRVLLFPTAYGDLQNPGPVTQYADIFYDDASTSLYLAYSREDQNTGGGSPGACTSIVWHKIPWTATSADFPEPSEVPARTIVAGEAIFAGRTVPGAQRLVYAATLSPDARWGNVLHCTLTGNVTLNAPTYPMPWQEMRIILIQDATGLRILTLGTGWRSGITTPTLQTAAGAVDYIRAIYNPLVATWDIIP